MFEVEVWNVAGEPAAIGNAGPYTLVMDRPAASTPVEYDLELSGDEIAEIPVRTETP
jgi:hypothetical protein